MTMSNVMILLRILVSIVLMVALGACAGPTTASKLGKPSSSKKNETPGSIGASSLAGGDFQFNLQRSLNFLKQGKNKSARKLLEALAASHEEKGKVFNALGVVYKRQGETAKAIKAYKKAVQHQETSVEAHYNLGILYRESGKFKKAEDEYRRSLSLNPEFAPAHYNLGILYDLYMNRSEDALRHYKEYQRLGGKGDMLNVWIKDLQFRVQTQKDSGSSKPTGGVQ